MIIGSHVSFGSKGLLGSVKEALSYEANTFMFYTGAPQNTLRKPIDINSTQEAWNLMKENNIDIMIEDSIKNCEDIENNGVKCYIMNTRYNKHETRFERVKRWNEIYSKISKLYKKDNKKEKIKLKNIKFTMHTNILKEIKGVADIISKKIKEEESNISFPRVLERKADFLASIERAYRREGLLLKR